MAAQPNWDMTPYFPEFAGSAYREFRADLEADVGDLLGDVRSAAPLTRETVATWAALLVRLEEIASRSSHLQSYLGCLGAADARDEEIQREVADAAVLGAEISKVFVVVRAAFREVQETPVVAHADELETSLYLHLAPERVRRGEMRAGNDVVGEYLSSDSTSNYPVRFNDYWGRWTQLGVHGDPTAATAEKGRAIFEAAVSGLIKFVDEWRAWPIAERSDQHARPVQSQIRW